MIGQPHPGLVSRDVVAVDGNIATIREVWDLTVPGCPMVAFHRPVDWWKPGAAVMERDQAAVSCVHTYRKPLGA